MEKEKEKEEGMDLLTLIRFEAGGWALESRLSETPLPGWEEAPEWFTVGMRAQKAADGQIVPVPETPDDATRVHDSLSAIDSERDARIARGKPHVFPDGTTGTVQLRHARDTANVNALASAGTALLALQDQHSTLAFRDGEDVTHSLTAAEAVQLGLAVMQWVSAHYTAAWAHKDALRALLATANDAGASKSARTRARKDIAAYDFSIGWPAAVT